MPDGPPSDDFMRALLAHALGVNLGDGGHAVRELAKNWSEVTERRPKWLLDWQDYPHGGVSKDEAREMNRYIVYLEEELKSRIPILDPGRGQLDVEAAFARAFSSDGRTKLEVSSIADEVQRSETAQRIRRRMFQGLLRYVEEGLSVETGDAMLVVAMSYAFKAGRIYERGSADGATA